MSKEIKQKNFSNEDDLALLALNKVKCNLFGNFAVLIEGHKGLKSYLLEKIIFKANKTQNVSVIGKNLSIKQLANRHALIVGEISGVIYEELS